MTRVDVIACGKLGPDLGLVLRGLPGWIENRFAWTQVTFRSAVTIETPLHRQRRGLAHQPHPSHVAVTGGAPNPFCDMDRMIKIDVAGEAVHALPGHWLVLGKTFADRREHLRVGPYLRMAGHAGLGRRDAGEARLLHRGVAIAAV